MITKFDMVYLIPLLITSLCVFFYDYKNTKYGNKKIYLLLYIYCSAISGLSYRLGIDVVSFYVKEIEGYPSLYGLTFDKLFNTPGRQPGWIFFCSLANTIFHSYYFVKTIISFIINGAVFYAIQKRSQYKYTGILCYFLFLFCYFNFEILRESLAISLFLISLNYFEKERWVKYYSLVFLAFLFHESSIFLVLLPLVKKIKITYTTTCFYIGIAAVLMIFADLFSWIPQFIASIPIFADKADHYINNDYFGGTRQFSINQLLSYILSIYLPLFMVYKMRSRNRSVKYESLVITYIFISIFRSFFPIMMRLQNYLSIFYFMFYIEMLKFIVGDLLKAKYRTLPQAIICSAYVLYTFSQGMVKPNERFYNFPQVVVYYPYASILDKDVDMIRETFYYIYLGKRVSL